MTREDCGCKKRDDFHPGRKKDDDHHKKCDDSCIDGLKEKLHRCEWVAVFTKHSDYPVYGHIKKVTCDVLVLDQVYDPYIPYATEAIIPLCEVEKVLKFGPTAFVPEDIQDAVKRMVE